MRVTSIRNVNKNLEFFIEDLTKGEGSYDFSKQDCTKTQHKKFIVGGQ
jgi:hypothetical protein